ncbi:MAG: hypothetical protein QOD03_1561, partial [Verrucomicrobiota bacterium]
MTNQPEFGRERNFVSAALPWLVALFAFAIYIQTLNHWVALNGLPLIAHATGQASTADIYFPCFSLVTYPLQWLPLRWIPIVSNLFSTMCAVLTLMLLARSVSLLPHDRTHSQRQRENDEFSLLSIRLAWIPPVLAACVCGLQLSFWENATSISVDMFDLLLLAYAIRCFLEFRI